MTFYVPSVVRIISRRKGKESRQADSKNNNNNNKEKKKKRKEKHKMDSDLTDRQTNIEAHSRLRYNHTADHPDRNRHMYSDLTVWQTNKNRGTQLVTLQSHSRSP